MSQTKPWHEDDAFWATFASSMFTPERWEAVAEEVDQLLALAKTEPGARVLDLCCGPGRHSLELARRGYLVTGVDRTVAYVEQARGKAEADGLSAEFVQEDMRRFCRPGEFDAALNLFTAFGYFEDQDEDRLVLANLHRSLKPGGTLVMDLMGKERLARIFRERDWHEVDGALMLTERRICQNWSWIENRWILITDEGRKEFTVSHRLYSASELDALLVECGFSSVSIYGDLSGAPYDHEAKRLVAVARK